MTEPLDTYRTGKSETPDFSPRILELIGAAWLLASVEYDELMVRSGHLLATLVADSQLQKETCEISNELARIDVPALLTNLPSITAETTEAAEVAVLQLTAATGRLPSSFSDRDRIGPTDDAANREFPRSNHDDRGDYETHLNKLRTIMLGDEAKVRRLIEYEQSVNPTGQRIQWVVAAIARWQRDNR